MHLPFQCIDNNDNAICHLYVQWRLRCHPSSWKSPISILVHTAGTATERKEMSLPTHRSRSANEILVQKSVRGRVFGILIRPAGFMQERPPQPHKAAVYMYLFGHFGGGGGSKRDSIIIKIIKIQGIKQDGKRSLIVCMHALHTCLTTTRSPFLEVSMTIACIAAFVQCILVGDRPCFVSRHWAEGSFFAD